MSSEELSSNDVKIIDASIISGEEWFTQVFKTKLDEMMASAPKDFEVKEDTGAGGGFFNSGEDFVDKEKLKKEHFAKQRLAILNECHELLKVEMREILISKTERKRVAKELIENLRKDAEKEVANAVEIANAERTKVAAQIAEKKAKAEAEAKKQAGGVEARVAVAVSSQQGSKDAFGANEERGQNALL